MRLKESGGSPEDYYKVEDRKVSLSVTVEILEGLYRRSPSVDVVSEQEVLRFVWNLQTTFGFLRGDECVMRGDSPILIFPVHVHFPMKRRKRVTTGGGP